MAEPIKAGLTRRKARQDIAHAIRYDLLMISFAYLPAIRKEQEKISPSKVAQLAELLALPAYEHYWATNKTAFFNSMNLRELQWNCEDLLNNVQRWKEEQIAQDTALDAISDAATKAIDITSKEQTMLHTIVMRYRNWRSQRRIAANAFTNEAK